MDLVRQLLEYKRVKEAAQKLSELAESHSRLFPGAGLAPPDEEPTVDLREVDLWDLLAAFQKVMRETGGLRPHEVVRSDVPVDTYIKHLLLILQKHKRVAFHEIFARSAERMHMIGMFLAILELVREGRIFASQNEDFGEIYLGLLGEEPGPSEVRSAEPALSEVEGCGVRPDAASGSTQNSQGLSPSPAPEEKTGENAPPQDE